MVRTETCIEAHQWSESEKRWIKIGNVTGGSNDSQTSGSGVKTQYQGKVNELEVLGYIAVGCMKAYCVLYLSS